MSLVIIMWEIQNEHVLLFFAITLSIITWNDGRMINALVCEHEHE
jgi:hypothetical protein